ncbi:MAG: hypothetical protein IBX50_18185 [Marinospirillum sp.]|uniref:hypothetical protein n=1 Tax=Marinospirillum sp. TaxID=2183934 RepID=UPI0019DF1A9E|nr:hypothetical protein [Marinospirillum sp.]MBE0508617.1 hypothetical protein [Marinospirillum sp.]
MAWLVDQYVEHFQGYEFSHLASDLVTLVSKSYLTAFGKGQVTKGKRMSLPGKKKGKETAYYFKNAAALAKLAKQFAEEANDRVVAILFRDSDGTASADRGDWQKKLESMQYGFASEHFSDGIGMLAKPKSEAWLLCALKPDNPYQHCAQLEEASGNDRSPNSLKDQLAEILGEEPTATILAEKVKSREIDVLQIDMPSLNAFKQELKARI